MHGKGVLVAIFNKSKCKSRECVRGGEGGWVRRGVGRPEEQSCLFFNKRFVEMLIK